MITNPPVAGQDYPRNLKEFLWMFPYDEACRDYLLRVRWPTGFRSPKLRRSGWVAQSVEAVVPELPRWEKRLRERGFDTVPRYPGQRPARVENELNLLMRQAARVRDSAIERQLRNLTQVRPPKAVAEIGRASCRERV